MGGRKPERGAGTKLDGWRFSSANKAAIEKIAATYGGQVIPWPERGQWEVFTTSATISVVVSHDSAEEDYELYDGQTLTRLCDGCLCRHIEVLREDPTKPKKATGAIDHGVVPCLCAEATELICLKSTALRVMLPCTNDITKWRLETKGEIANKELFAFCSMLERQGLYEAYALLTIEQQSKTVGEKKTNWVTPKLSLDPNPPNWVETMMLSTPRSQAAVLMAREGAPALAMRAQEDPAAVAAKEKARSLLSAKGWLDKEFAPKLTEIGEICKAKGRTLNGVINLAYEAGVLETLDDLEMYAERLGPAEHTGEDDVVINADFKLE